MEGALTSNGDTEVGRHNGAVAHNDATLHCPHGWRLGGRTDLCNQYQ